MLRKLPGFLKSLQPVTVATVQAPVASTDEHRSAPIDSGVQGCAPVETDVEECVPLVLGSMRSAKEHAEMVVDAIRHYGLCGRALYQGDLQRMHAEMCEGLGWLPKGWPAVCRELARLPSVKRGLVKIEGHRLTVYEVEPAAEASNVVPIERRRDAS